MSILQFFHKKMEKVNTFPAPKIAITYHEYTPKEIEQQANAEAERIAKIDADCRKSEHGLTVSQILLLEYCKKGKYPNPEGGYQHFWWFDYGVKSVGDVLRKLEAGGFIRFAIPSELLPAMKVDELKGILTKLKLSTTGKKSVLVDRIKSNADDSVLQQFVRSKKYTLTELGEKELAANQYVPYLHTHKYSEITIWDVNKYADLDHWRDWIWGKFNKCSMDYFSKGQWGLYRNARFSMAEFLFDEERYTDSFAMYGEVCFYDINGMDDFIDYDDPSDLLMEGIMTKMKIVADKAELSEDKMRDILIKRVEGLYPVKCRVPNGQMTDLILNKLNSLG